MSIGIILLAVLCLAFVQQSPGLANSKVSSKGSDSSKGKYYLTMLKNDDDLTDSNTDSSSSEYMLLHFEKKKNKVNESKKPQNKGAKRVKVKSLEGKSKQEKTQKEKKKEDIEEEAGVDYIDDDAEALDLMAADANDTKTNEESPKPPQLVVDSEQPSPYPESVIKKLKENEKVGNPNTNGSDENANIGNNKTNVLSTFEESSFKSIKQDQSAPSNDSNDDIASREEESSQSAVQNDSQSIDVDDDDDVETGDDYADDSVEHHNTARVGLAPEDKSKEVKLKQVNSLLETLTTEELGDDYNDDDKLTKGIDIAKFFKVMDENACKECSQFSEAHRRAIRKLADFLMAIPNLSYKVFNKLVLVMKKKVEMSVVLSVVNSVLVLRKDWKMPVILHSDLLELKKGDTNKFIHELSNSVEIDPSVSPVRGKDQRMDFFREDIFFNAMHDIWHQFNVMAAYPREDHRERFIYFHKQLLFRYLVDAHVAGLDPIKPLDPNEKNIDSYYRSVLPWTQDMYRTNNTDKCSFSKERIEKLNKGRAETLETTSVSEFRKRLEAGFHDELHEAIGLECVMGNATQGFQVFTSVSARQPIFYRIHTAVEKLSQEFFSRRNYTTEEIMPAEGYSLAGISCKTECGKTQPSNRIRTFMKKHSFMTKKGLTFNYTRLEHEEFYLDLKINNPKLVKKRVIMRIFLVLEEFVNDAKWNIEMERRVLDLPNFRIIHLRWKSKFNRFTTKDFNTTEFGESWQWHCGWPHHMYLPKGSPEGTSYRLVVFLHDVEPGVNEGNEKMSHMTCGLPWNGMVKDKREMGFPFNRKWNGMDIKNMMDHKIPEFGANTIKVTISHAGLRKREKRDFCD